MFCTRGTLTKPYLRLRVSSHVDFWKLFQFRGTFFFFLNPQNCPRAQRLRDAVQNFCEARCASLHSTETIRSVPPSWETSLAHEACPKYHSSSPSWRNEGMQSHTSHLWHLHWRGLQLHSGIECHYHKIILSTDPGWVTVCINMSSQRTHGPVTMCKSELAAVYIPAHATPQPPARASLLPQTERLYIFSCKGITPPNNLPELQRAMKSKKPKHEWKGSLPH